MSERCTCAYGYCVIHHVLAGLRGPEAILDPSTPDRPTLLRMWQAAMDEGDRLDRLLSEAREETRKWQRIRQPTHGPCCTCQVCGLAYDECRCCLDDVADRLSIATEALKAILKCGGCPECRDAASLALAKIEES